MKQTCKQCNSEFVCVGNKRFCSDECYRLFRKSKRRRKPVEFLCEICGTPFTQHRKDNVTCSETCSQRLWVKNNPRKAYLRYHSKRSQKRVKLWVSKNKDKLRVIARRYKNKRLTTDPTFRLNHCIGNLIRDSFKSIGKKKNTKTAIILGCSPVDFRKHIESKFEPWMNWDNYGLWNGESNYGWDIDHIIPTSSATTIDEVIKLNHYTNLQPLCSHKNRDLKRNKLDFL